MQQRPDERVPATAQVRADPVAGAVARISLQPVDGVHVTTLIDNSSDVLLPDEGLVRRWGLAGTAGPLPIIPGGMAGEGRTVDFLRAEHGFSALVEVHAGGRTRRVLFDAGGTPDGLTANLDRLALSPDTFEAIVFSHGHFDHVMGLDGLAHRLGPRNLPVLIHPDFWTRRRVATPNGALELPTPSRAAIEGAGFTIVEDRHPSFLLDGMLLVTGEVDRTTDFETGMPAAHQAWRNGGWQADRLVHDDQAIVLHVQEKGLVVLTGCGHAGIVNIVRHAKRLTGVARFTPSSAGSTCGTARPFRNRWLPSPPRRRLLSCPRTAPHGRHSTLWPPNCRRPSTRTPSVAGSSSDNGSRIAQAARR